MSNQLTSGLLAAAIMAGLNIVMGNDPISWNVFLAAMFAMILNLDIGNSRVAVGSPVAHSMGWGIIFIYLAGVIAFAAHVFFEIQLIIAIDFTLSIGAGVLAHLLAELATGRMIYTFPRNLDAPSWFAHCDTGSCRFWGAWGRVSIGKRRFSDTYMNAFSIGLVLFSIWMG